jgi:hypothetical protein
MMSSIFDDLYEIGDPVANRPFRGSVDCSTEDATAFSRAERLPAAPVMVSWGMGTGVPSDVIWTLLGLPLIVSSKFIDLLRDAQFTGWDTYDVRVTAKDGRAVSGFYGLALTGRCDSPDLARSELVLREYPGGWFPVLRGCFFAESSWDGSDLFMEQPDERGNRTLNRYVTGRVLKAFRRSRISNLRIEKLSDLEVSASVYEIGSRYRLPRDYDARVDTLYARKRASDVPL